MIIQSILSRISHTTDNLHNKTIALVATIILLCAGWMLTSRVAAKVSSNHTTRNADADRSTEQGSIKVNKPIAKEASELRNVFSIKQRPPITRNGSKKDVSDRPFGSSYYYAHNNSNSKGGYTDGLRAEDYAMNGPRLLSKDGVRVNDSEELDTYKTLCKEEDHADTTHQNKNATREKQQVVTASRQITRYLWDDDGEGDNAKIHIDCLPKSSTETISWKEAEIAKDDVEVRLVGDDNDGLIVNIFSQDQKKYHLHVPKMYGSADSVKFIVKKHKLLIKITKRKIKMRQSSKGFIGSVSEALLGKSESYRSVKWPQLSSTGGEIDEKLFKEVDYTDRSLFE